MLLAPCSSWCAAVPWCECPKYVRRAHTVLQGDVGLGLTRARRWCGSGRNWGALTRPTWGPCPDRWPRAPRPCVRAPRRRRLRWRAWSAGHATWGRASGCPDTRTSTDWACARRTGYARRPPPPPKHTTGKRSADAKHARMQRQLTRCPAAPTPLRAGRGRPCQRRAPCRRQDHPLER